MVPDYLDVDVIDPDSPAPASGRQRWWRTTEDETADTEVTLAVDDDDDEDTFDDDDADQYEYVDDTSGIPVAARNR